LCDITMVQRASLSTFRVPGYLHLQGEVSKQGPRFCAMFSEKSANQPMTTQCHGSIT